MDSTHNQFLRHSENVFRPTSEITTVSFSDLEFLRDQAHLLPDQKARILLHSDPTRSLHEMLITHTRGTYIQPHINEHSAKSFLVLLGEMVVVLFTEDGLIETCHRLTALGAGENFMVRLENPIYHTVIILTETVVFLETVLGPHEHTRYAKFAPRSEEVEPSQKYLAWLEQKTALVKPT